ncbi:MAG: response regulator [Firmicutes bacterium]|nr:response regulator [Bacillota bacterium]
MKIWIVDDNKNLLEVMQESLHDDHAVLLFASEQELIQHVGMSGGETPDVVLLDWNLSGTVATELFSILMAAYPQCHVVIMSGDFTSSREWPPNAGKLEKPFKLFELKRYLEELPVTRV